MSEQQRKNAAARSVEARKKAQMPAPVVDWDRAIANLMITLDEVYRPRRKRRDQR